MRAVRVLVGVAIVMALLLWGGVSLTAPDRAAPREASTHGSAETPGQPAAAPEDAVTDGGRRRVARASSGDSGDEEAIVDLVDMAFADGVVRGRVIEWVVVESAQDGTIEEARPCPGLPVSVHLDEPETEFEQFLTTIRSPSEVLRTDASGRFEFEVAVEGRWRLSVEMPDGRLSGASGAGPDDIGDVTFHESGVSCFEIVDDNGSTRIEGSWALVYASTNDAVPTRRVESEGHLIRLPSTAARALFTAPGHAFSEATGPFDLESDGDIERINLYRGFDVGGRVVDENGEPWTQLRVRLTDDGPERVARTDAEGRFQFPRAAGYEGVQLAFDVGDRWVGRPIALGEVDARIVIPRDGDVSGRIVYPDGTPAPRVAVAGLDIAEDGSFRYWAHGGETVHRFFGRLREMVTDFPAPIPTYVLDEQVTLRPGGVHDVTLVLRESETSFVRFAVRDPDGEPVRAMIGSPDQVRMDDVADGEEQLVAVGVAPGSSVRVRVYERTNALVPVVRTVTTAATTACAAVPVTLERGRPLAVRLLDHDGNEVPRATWSSFVVQGGEAVVLPDGRIDAPLGAFVRVVVTTADLRLDRQIKLPFGEPWELVLRVPEPHAVSARVVNASGAPVKDVSVVLIPLPYSSHDHPRDVTDDDGAFSIQRAPAGRALLVGWAPPGDVLALRREIIVPEEGDFDLGAIQAWEDTLLEGTVTVPAEQSASGLLVEVRFADSKEERSTHTDDEGRFSLRVPGAPDAVIGVSRQGRMMGLQAADLTRTRRVGIDVQAVGSARFIVPVAWRERGFDVWILVGESDRRWPAQTQRGSAAGEWHAHGLPAGEWRLRFEADEHAFERTVTIRPETETEITLPE